MTSSVVLAVVLLSLAALLASGDTCANVPTMSMYDACHRACDRHNWCHVCPERLSSAPDTAEATVYALVAVRLAKLQFEDTMAAIDQTMTGNKLVGDDRAAAENCKAKYGDACDATRSITDQLFTCDFATVKREFHGMINEDLESCRNGLLPSSLRSLLAKVYADHDLVNVASALTTTT